MQQLRTRMRAGTTVTARGDLWSIAGSEHFDAGLFVALEGRGRGNRGQRTTLISPFDTIEPVFPRGLAWRRRRSAIRTALLALARSRPPSGLWTAVEGRFDLHAWQLAPALAVLDGTPRVLLADAVGLGKTLQAGLIAAELAARGLARHTLVLAPPALRDTWAAELGDRLGLEVAILDPAAITACHRARGGGANPWTSAPVIVSSIDFVKRAEVRAAVEAVPLDLLIVDEAHHLTPGSDRAAVVARFARRAPWLLLVSATPHSGDAGAFRALVELGSTGDAAEPPMRVFRRTPAEAGVHRRRRSTVLAVTPTAAELALVEGLLGYARAICHGPLGARPGVRLVAGVLVRRASSSAWAAECTLLRRLAALAGEPPGGETAQPALPWEEPDQGDVPEDAWIGVPGLPPGSGESERLRELATLARAARARPSKLLRLRRLLARLGEPAVVFTEFRDTLEACRAALESDREVACLHGGLGAAERRRALADFLGGRATVLLATDVAGEGLNLQTRARIVVTVEWPWNPQRLEQRIGRVDRLGQTRAVHAVHLTAKGTFEDTVLARMLARSARSRDELARLASLPAGPALEAAVLDGAECLIASPAALAPAADAAALREAHRLVEFRRLTSRAGLAPPEPCWAWPRRRTRPVRVAVLVEVSAARAGRLAWSTVVPLQVHLAYGPHDRRAWKAVCRQVARAADVHRAARAAARSAAGEVPRWRELSARVEAIRRGLAAGSPTPVQPSLFDRRAVRDAEARAAVVALLDDHLRQVATTAADDTGDIDIDTCVLVVLPLDWDGP